MKTTPTASTGTATGSTVTPRARYFVFESGNDANNGSGGAPLYNIRTAIDRVVGDPETTDVYVATGVYEGSLLLRLGVHVYGGYSPGFDDRDPGTFTKVVFGGASSGSLPGAVNGRNLSGGCRCPPPCSRFLSAGGPVHRRGGGGASTGRAPSAGRTVSSSAGELWGPRVACTA